MEVREQQSRVGAGFALVALGAALWGSDALFRRGLALELPASAVVFAEHLILAAVTVPMVVRAVPRLRGLPRARWADLALIGVGASATATVLFTAAFAFGDPTTPVLLQKLQPLIAIAAARAILGERLLPRFGIYAAAALAGAWLIAFPNPLAVRAEAVVPALLALGAAALWAMGTVLGRRLAGLLPHQELTALRFWIGLPATAVLVALGPGWGWMPTLTPRDGLALLLLSLLPGLLALNLYYRGLRSTPASAATLAELAFPVSALVVGRVAFGAELSATQWIGVVVLVGTIAVMAAAGRASASRLGVHTRAPEREVPVGTVRS